MSTFDLIPYRLYLSQSKTWMHKIKAETKIYTLLLLWISIFFLSFYKLLNIAFSLIMISFTIKANKFFIKKHFIQTLGMTVVTLLFSVSLLSNYESYLNTEPSQHEILKSNTYTITKVHIFTNKKKHQLLGKPAIYFFIAVYSIKLIMTTTSPEILAITIYKTRKSSNLTNNELLFIFLLSSHIINSIILKFEKIKQVISLRGNLNLYKQSTKLFLVLFLISNLFFSEIIKESLTISQALYTRNLNRENNNFLKIYRSTYSVNDYLGVIICTAYMAILFLI